MNATTAAISRQTDSAAAANELAASIRTAFRGQAADAVIVFASAQHDFERLLGTLADEVGTEVIAGSSSAGEFTHQGSGEGFASALALRSAEMSFAVGLGTSLQEDPIAAARTVAAAFRGRSQNAFAHRSALVMTDALAGHADAVVEELTVATGGNYGFFGGGAGDDGRFRETHVFAGRRAYTNALVALEILSSRAIGIGVSHGWEPVGEGLRVTEAKGARLVSLNGMPAVDAFEQHAEATGQEFDASQPLPFFLHNILGIRGAEGFRLRVPLGVAPDGSVLCAAAIPTGSVVQLMATSGEAAVRAAEKAARAALAAIGGSQPGGALVFDCVATRLRLGRGFDDELKACADLLGPAGFVGCNTYGQVARAEGQFGGFHNCTAVVCVIPE